MLGNKEEKMLIILMGVVAFIVLLVIAWKYLM
ncbi:hypothetical protein DET59_10636 [Rossellomorea aquimaris]|uniref:Uncharacterized protein n=1 Tax=Rossellomorea aquimaris TaxID=189382 RepID=A0A366ERE6_9BACI|nr:hypothetical protein DET59_10636 [Rossellomorea aquimaris]